MHQPFSTITYHFYNESLTHPHFLRSNFVQWTSRIRTEKIWLHQDWKVRSITDFRVISNTNLTRGTPYTTFHLARKLAEFKKGSELLSRRFLHSPSFFSLHFRRVKRWAYTRTGVNPRWITRDPVPFPVAPSVARERSHRPLPPFSTRSRAPPSTLVRTSKGINVRFHVTMGVTTFTSSWYFFLGCALMSRLISRYFITSRYAFHKCNSLTTRFHVILRIVTFFVVVTSFLTSWHRFFSVWDNWVINFICELELICLHDEI